MELAEEAAHWRTTLARALEPGPPLGHARAREPVHTLYWGAHRFERGTAPLIEAAQRALDTYAPNAATLAEALEIDQDLATTLHEAVAQKLHGEPIEDLRLDFEDGYGVRPDAEEDAAATNAGNVLAREQAEGRAPRRVGLRIKPLTPQLFARSARTLERFLTALSQGGPVGDVVVTLPKTTVPEQLLALCELLQRAEQRAGLTEGTVGVEFMVEVPQAVFDPEGRLWLPRLLRAAGPRLLGVHLGVYDYTAAHDIAAQHQALDHPACDLVRGLMKLCCAGSPVVVSAGSTNVLPVEPHIGDALTPEQRHANGAALHATRRLAHRHIGHALAGGFYHGWDLHPAQLVARYAACFGFFLAGAEVMATRLRHVRETHTGATDHAAVLDDVATAQALFGFFKRGYACGALSEAHLARAGLEPGELHAVSYATLAIAVTRRA